MEIYSPSLEKRVQRKKVTIDFSRSLQVFFCILILTFNLDSYCHSERLVCTSLEITIWLSNILLINQHQQTVGYQHHHWYYDNNKIQIDIHSNCRIGVTMYMGTNI